MGSGVSAGNDGGADGIDDANIIGIHRDHATRRARVVLSLNICTPTFFGCCIVIYSEEGKNKSDLMRVTIRSCDDHHSCN